MFQNKAIYKQALWCFFLFFVLSKPSFSQSTNDSLIFQIPENNPWDNPWEIPWNTPWKIPWKIPLDFP